LPYVVAGFKEDISVQSRNGVKENRVQREKSATGDIKP